MQKILSVFIDESGDFGDYDKHCPYYLVTLLFHNQSDNIDSDINHLEHALNDKGCLGHILHTGPLIRREEAYQFMRVEERKSILNSFINFTAKIPIKYHTIVVEKKPNTNHLNLISALSENIRDFLTEQNYLSIYDQIIVYYDNGQNELTKIIASVFASTKTAFRKIVPPDYRLFQIADLLTTFELIMKKRENNLNSKSELQLFGSMGDFKKNYYKRIAKHKI